MLCGLIEAVLIILLHNAEMSICLTRRIFAVVMIALSAVAFISTAKSQNRFHVKSQKLPGTLEAGNPNCPELSASPDTAGVEYVPGRTASGTKLVPADVDPVKRGSYPIVRFDLNTGNRRRNRLGASGLTIGEVSIDTATGEVALDGEDLAPKKHRKGCGTPGRY